MIWQILVVVLAYYEYSTNTQTDVSLGSGDAGCDDRRLGFLHDAPISECNSECARLSGGRRAATCRRSATSIRTNEISPTRTRRWAATRRRGERQQMKVRELMSAFVYASRRLVCPPNSNCAESEDAELEALLESYNLKARLQKAAWRAGESNACRRSTTRSRCSRESSGCSFSSPKPPTISKRSPRRAHNQTISYRAAVSIRKIAIRRLWTPPLAAQDRGGKF